MSVRTLRYNTIEQHFTKSANASTDRDALAFLEAAQIYNTNQQRAIVNLVRSLKRTGLWSKMKAIYPFIGGTATSHKWNLKDPRDVDAAFRLTFSGGWTHSSTGALPNGTTGYANTFYNTSSVDVENNRAFTLYLRTNTAGSNTKQEFGAYDQTPFPDLTWQIYARAADNNCYVNIGPNFTTFANADAKGYYIVSKASTNTLNAWKNSTKVVTNFNTGTGAVNYNAFIGARNLDGSANNYSDREISFVTMGEGFTATDATNLYNIVQRYQFQLGRAIEPDAQAFIDAAGITDATQQAAILDLVVRLKNDGLWSKMKAIYPFVGGTASSHKWNLKDPRDADAAFRLSFQGGWTHSTDGATPNGTNAYANTFLAPNSVLTLNSTHMSYYSRTAGTTNNVTEIGCSSGTGELPIMLMEFARNGTNAISDAYDFVNNRINVSNTDTTGLLISTRTSSTSHKLYLDTTTLGTDTATQSRTSLPITNLPIAAYLNNVFGNTWSRFSTKQTAFVSIGDGLTDADASNLYNIVDLYQKRLGRAV